MPRDGSNIYSLPFPDVVTLTTIESAKYNGTLNDIKTDLNTPRPIVAGGTGATTAPAALTALSGEIASAGQIVTNYGTQVFAAGSFQSAANATGAPNTTDRFVGTALVYGANDISLEALSLEAGKVWTRKKTGGTWAAWVDAGVGPYVPIPGGTMTGPLVINSTNAGALVVGPNGTTNPVLKIDDSGASAANGIVVTGRAAATGVAIDAISSGANENLVVRGKGAGGVQLGSTGGATGLVVTGLAAGSGVTVDAVSTGANESLLIRGKGTSGVQLGSSASPTKYVSVDGFNLFCNGLNTVINPATDRRLAVENSTTPTGIRIHSTNQAVNADAPLEINASTIWFQSSTGAGSNLVYFGAAPAAFSGLVTTTYNGDIVSPAVVNHNQSGSGGAQYAIFFGRNNANVGNIGTNATSTSYTTSSDARLKTDERPVTNAPAILDRLRVWDFQWIKTGERDIGLIAQEAEPEFPHAIIPPLSPDAAWTIDYSKYVPLLIQDAQDTHARLDALEARVTALEAALQAAKP